MEPAPFERAESLRRMGTDRFDLVVVGGGITGCGVALDAAARGLRTALVEADDFASGTSSRSSKLVHGGVRYLQQHDYRLVYEALRERQRLLENAPHVVHPLPFLVPLFGSAGVVGKSVSQAYSLALWTYDLTGGMRIGKRHRRIGATEALAHFPQLRTDRLMSAFLYWDAQTDDARLTLAIARTAAARGAVLVNHAPVAAVLRDGDDRVIGVRLADGTCVESRVVVNAGGVWSEEISGPRPGRSPVSIRPAKGVHVAVPAAKLPCDFAAVLSVPGDRRSIFVVPWAADTAQAPDGPGRYTYIGTTDTDYKGPLADPGCTIDEVEYLLGAVNAWTRADLTPADVTSAWAGLRPLVRDARSARTADLSRRHTVIRSPDGLITVTGGKLTTYRQMAADTVDVVVGQIAGPGPGRPTRSPTRHLRLVGAPPDARSGRRHRDGPEPGPDHLGGRYGTEAGDVRALIDAERALGRPLAPGLPYLRAEAVHAIRREMAGTIDDVLDRRTRVAALDLAAAAAAAPDVGALLAGEHGWDEETTAREVAAYRARLDARWPRATG